MIYEVFIYDIVNDEIEAVISYYENVLYELGLRFENTIEKVLDDLEKNPEYYFNPEDKKHRRVTIDGFPYALIYSIDGNA